MHFFLMSHSTGRDVRCPSAEEMVYTIKERHYFDQIERAYSYASRLVLDLLMSEHKLVSRLKWVICLVFIVDIISEIDGTFF